MNKLLGLLLTLVVLCGCATSYQDSGFTGGYDETQIRENSWIVRFRGNGYTKASRAADFCLLRCAQLAMENGYSHFIIVDSKESTKTGSFTTGKSAYTTGSLQGNQFYANTYTSGGQTYTFHKPRSTNTIIALSEEEATNLPNAFEARFVIRSIKNKYNLK